MGVGYRARDPVLNRDVAVKLIPPTLLAPESEQRLKQLVAQMDPPSIVSIHDFGRHGSLKRSWIPFLFRLLGWI